MSPETIDAMIAAGVTAEVLAAAWKAEIAKQQETASQRRAKDAERQRRHRESRDVTVTACDVTLEASPLTTPPKKAPDPKNTPPLISPQPTKECARAVRLPADWKPLEIAGKAAAMVACWQSGELERELAKFKNYWMAKGGKDATKRDWQRTWINWLISADERKPRHGNATGTDSLTALALQRIGALQH